MYEKIEKKTPLAYGTEHSIYINQHNPNTVFKVVNPDFNDVPNQIYNWIKIFKENPSLFPKVYKSSDRGAEVEKVDYVKAKQDYSEVEHIIDSKFGKTSFKEVLFDTVEKTNGYKDKINKCNTFLMETDQKLAFIFQKFVALMIKLQHINQEENSIDIHMGNFGYDRSGKLKMIDL